MTDDIDDKHNLNSHAKYVEAMKQVEHDQKSPCIECEESCNLDQQFRCQKYRNWKKRMMIFS